MSKTGSVSKKIMEFTKDQDFRTMCQKGGVQDTIEILANDFYKNLK